MSAEPLQIDVRQIPPRERHPVIFARFDQLAPGESLILINDHDPKPLYYQFQAERAGQMSWEPEEEGPERWVIRIRKLGVPGPNTHPTRPTQPLRDEHQELLPHVDRLRELGDAAEESNPELKALMDKRLEFLQDHLLIHARAEEQVLYPAVAKLLGGPQATATMSRDHVEVERLTAALVELRQAWGDVPAAEQLASLRRLAYGLFTLVTVHFAKEEEIYLPLLDASFTPDQASGLFADMERAASKARAR